MGSNLESGTTAFICELPPDERLNRFYELLRSDDPRLRLYVYRIEDGRREKPPIHKGRVIPKLEAYLQKEFNGGKFDVMVRRGSTMILVHTVPVCCLPE